MPRSIHTDEYRALTALLLETRQKAGLTQQEIAARLGRPQSYVAKIEGAERRIDVVEFIALTRAIGADPRDVFDAVLAKLKT